MKKPQVLLMASLLVSLLCSCEHKELDFSGTADLIVAFDWTNAPEANPSSMMLMAFYSQAQPVQKPVEGRASGRISLPKGNYQFIAFNDDVEDVSSRGSDWADYEVFAHQTELSTASRMFVGTRNIPRGTGTEDQLVICEPDEVWTSAVDNASVTGTIGNTVTMPMEPATFIVRFTIKNVNNIEFVNDVIATVSGMSGSWWPSRHTCSCTQCIIPFNLTRSGSSYSGQVRTFGYRSRNEDGDEIKHLFVIYAELTDGSRKYYTFDVSDQMNAVVPDDGGIVTAEVNVELEELPLPKPLDEGTGLAPDVQDWEEVLIAIPL